MTGATEVIAKLDLAYVACAGCGVVRLAPFPETSDTTSLYGDDYFTAAAHGGYDDYVADAAIHRRNGRLRVRRLGPVPEGHSILVDVGCAHGYTMDAARGAGWTPVGVEVNATARAAVEARGMRCAATVEDLDLAPGTVGAIGFFQVLEHMPDPVGALRWARRVLAPEGTVLVETWDRGSRVARLAGSHWQQANPPSVLWLFDERALGQLADRSGLELVGFGRSPKWVTLGQVVGQMRDRGTRDWWPRAGVRLRGVPIRYPLDDLVTARLRTQVTGG